MAEPLHGRGQRPPRTRLAPGRGSREAVLAQHVEMAHAVPREGEGAHLEPPVAGEADALGELGLGGLAEQPGSPNMGCEKE